MASILGRLSNEKLIIYAAAGAIACSGAYGANVWKTKRAMVRYSCYNDACSAFSDHPAAAKYLGEPINFQSPQVHFDSGPGIKISSTHSEVSFEVKGPANHGIVYAIAERPTREDKWLMKMVVLELSPEKIGGKFTYITILPEREEEPDEQRAEEDSDHRSWWSGLFFRW